MHFFHNSGQKTDANNTPRVAHGSPATTAANSAGFGRYNRDSPNNFGNKFSSDNNGFDRYGGPYSSVMTDAKPLSGGGNCPRFMPTGVNSQKGRSDRFFTPARNTVSSCLGNNVNKQGNNNKCVNALATTEELNSEWIIEEQKIRAEEAEKAAETNDVTSAAEIADQLVPSESTSNDFNNNVAAMPNANIGVKPTVYKSGGNFSGSDRGRGAAVDPTVGEIITLATTTTNPITSVRGSVGARFEPKPWGSGALAFKEACGGSPAQYRSSPPATRHTFDNRSSPLAGANGGESGLAARGAALKCNINNNSCVDSKLVANAATTTKPAKPLAASGGDELSYGAGFVATTKKTDTADFNTDALPAFNPQGAAVKQPSTTTTSRPFAFEDVAVTLNAANIAVAARPLDDSELRTLRVIHEFRPRAHSATTTTTSGSKSPVKIAIDQKDQLKRIINVSKELVEVMTKFLELFAA